MIVDGRTIEVMQRSLESLFEMHQNMATEAAEVLGFHRDEMSKLRDMTREAFADEIRAKLAEDPALRLARLTAAAPRYARTERHPQMLALLARHGVLHHDLAILGRWCGGSAGFRDESDVRIEVSSYLHLWQGETGIAIHLSPDHVFEVDGDGVRIHIDRETLPGTLAQSCIGRPLRDVLRHPDLDDPDLVIVAATERSLILRGDGP